MARYRPTNFTLPADYSFPGDPVLEIKPYIFSEAAVIAVDVALATSRPLLVAGPPGCGKSRLAEAMAATLGWNYLGKTITSRTRLEELTVEVDHLRRLHDAHRAARADAKQLKPDEAYHNPGIFWWAFDRESAARRGLSPADAIPHTVALPFPGTERRTDKPPQHTVLLIDEIDKAEPDVPNDLLEPLDRRSFCLPGGSTLHAKPKDQQQLLTIITTNRERELPQAFLRRCVSLVFDPPNKQALLAIAHAHHPEADPTRVEAIVGKIMSIREMPPEVGRRHPGTSEFLDAIQACEELKIAVADDNPLWRQIESAVLVKPAV
ncbi:MAG TPA: MoxR family ATPase [Accumulibacter sp.]|uniref:AAA family ATPase n=1 Tax=Accumulibacter sp. TaxID=2053492 RepID=UPI002BF506A1|nr:MoxR family ATPase [Accumulibacter sp.]HRF74735.1 MoxR family ATPase [Accumulibacter sp.]